MGQTLSMLYHLIDQARPPKPPFTISELPDQTNVVSIVTGSSSGVGYEIVKALLLKNGTVYLAARNRAKSEKAIERLRKETGGKEPVFLKVDLADLGSIEEAVKEFTSKEKYLHVLYNNAGIMVPPISELTVDGYDMQMGTNALGHFYLTKLLLPTLQRTSIATGKKSRVITCSSFTHMFISHDPTKALDFESFRDDTGAARRRKLGIDHLYAQSKFADILMAREMARRWGSYTNEEEGGSIISIPVNPGNLNTDLQRHTGGISRWLVEKIFLFPAWYGSMPPLYAGCYISEKEAERCSFDDKWGYIIPWGRVGKAHPLAYDRELAGRFWDWLEEQVERRKAQLEVSS